MNRRLFMATAGAALTAPNITGADGASLVLDDFASGQSHALHGNRWMGFTDQVMGGRSEGSAQLPRWRVHSSGPGLRRRPKTI
jgi:hypothetical protein